MWREVASVYAISWTNLVAGLLPTGQTENISHSQQNRQDSLSWNRLSLQKGRAPTPACATSRLPPGSPARAQVLGALEAGELEVLLHHEAHSGQHAHAPVLQLLERGRARARASASAPDPEKGDQNRFVLADTVCLAQGRRIRAKLRSLPSQRAKRRLEPGRGIENLALKVLGAGARDPAFCRFVVFLNLRSFAWVPVSFEGRLARGAI